ncbi:MAG: hypothetical protein ABIM89_13605, partial [Mycobacteriales bacterium]
MSPTGSPNAEHREGAAEGGYESVRLRVKQAPGGWRLAAGGWRLAAGCWLLSADTRLEFVGDRRRPGPAGTESRRRSLAEVGGAHPRV